MERETLRVREAAEVLGIGAGSVRRLVREGALPCMRIGERPLWRIPRSAVTQYIEDEAHAKPEE